MSDVAAAADLLSAAVIGPKAQGRNYGVRRYAGPPLSSEAQARIADFAMSLTGWAILRLDRMAAMFPLTADGQQFAVVRARRLGEADLGPVAVAHLLIVPRSLLDRLGWQSHRLLRLIPEPEDAAFAVDPPVPALDALAGPPAPLRGAPPQAAWADLTVDANGADPEEILAGLIDSIRPPEQRARVTGWATTSLLAKAGGLDPTALFRLVVHAPAESAGDFAATHHPVVLDAAQAGGDTPLAWRAFTRLQAIAGREPDAAPLKAAQWAPEKAATGAAAAMFEEIARACADLPPAGMVALLRAVARNAVGQDAVAQALRQGVSATFEAIVSLADAEGAAFYVQTFLQQADDRERAAIPGLAAAAAEPKVAAWLGDCVERLDLPDIARRWSGRIGEDAAWGETLSLAAPAIQDAVLKACLADPAASGRRRLAARLLRLHCARRADGPLVQAVLAALLAQPPGPDDVGLADRTVLEACERFVPGLTASLTERAVLPAMRAAGDREALYRAARALLVADGGRPVP